jgi:hypothetical protein
VVTHSAALERRCVSRTGEQVGQSGPGPERGDVVGRAVGVRSRHAIPGDEAIDQLRIAPGHRLEIEAETLQCAGPDVGHEHVGTGQQLECDPLPFGGGQVQHDAALGAVVHFERRVLPRLDLQHSPEHAGRVSRRRLDLDDVGTPVGEYPSGGGRRDPDSEFDDLDPCQRSSHANLPSASA